MNRKRLRTAKGLVFTAHRVGNLRHSYDIESGTADQKQRSEDIYTAEEAADLLGVHRITVARSVEVGLLRGSQMTPGAPWRVRVNEEDRRRLSVADSADGWLPLKGAAQMLGVSQQTVLQKIKTGQLQAVRVRVRRRSAWRRAPSLWPCGRAQVDIMRRRNSRKTPQKAPGYLRHAV